MSDEMSQVATWRDRLEQGIQTSIPDVMVNGATAPRLPTTTNISFKGVDGQSLVVALDLKGVATSSGSACSSGSLEPSHVLMAMGLTDEWLQGTIRFSLGSGNTREEVDLVLELLPPIVARLRQHRRGTFRQTTSTPSTMPQRP
jgi:cysteine desulfurase